MLVSLSSNRIKSLFVKLPLRIMSKRPAANAESMATVEKLARNSDSEKPMRRRHYAVLMMYSGKEFYGMQRQQEFPTIEGELLSSMLKANLINDDDYSQPSRIHFQRASKTDRRVSALGQLVSARLNEEVEDPKKSLNAFLPESIRVLDVLRVTKRFSAKDNASHRVYEYIMPTFVFAPQNKNADQSEMLKFRANAEMVDRFNNILANFKGTKNFYHFTSGREVFDKSCYRYMMSLECSQPHLYDSEIEYVVVTVIGQSFMLHQIRKMIGLAIAVFRDYAPQDIFEKVFDVRNIKEKHRMDLPKAPGLGLLLGRVMFDHYNERYGADHVKIDWTRYEEDVGRFKTESIISDMMKHEVDDQSMFNWLGALKNHTFVTSAPTAPRRLNPDNTGLAADNLLLTPVVE